MTISSSYTQKDTFPASTELSLPSSSCHLDWTQRSENLKQIIDKVFNKLSEQTGSGWGIYNGDNNYGICGVNEYRLMKKIIQQADGTQKEFYALDIGAGNFQWCEGLAKFLDQQTDLSSDIKVHIIGIRGENYLGAEVVDTDRCKIYRLGAFKVENLFEQFKTKNLDIENKVDLAVSRWTLRHLVDPVGTSIQIINHCLRPLTSYFLLDGFFFLTENDRLNDETHNFLLTRLFLDTKAPFLTKFYAGTRSLNHFMFQKPATPCQIRMRYQDSVYAGGAWQIGSNHVTQFQREPQETDQERFYLPSSLPNDFNILYGDKKIYEWLKKNNLLFEPSSTWHPLKDKDNALKIPALHKAILDEENFDEIKILLENEKTDINESDSYGRTPLHLLIDITSFELFKLALDKGASLELENGKRRTPLHEAACFDKEGRFLTTLISRGAKVNGEYKKTPLSCAIEAKNLKAIEILIREGAEISKKNFEDLENPEFFSLHEQGIIPPYRSKES